MPLPPPDFPVLHKARFACRRQAGTPGPDNLRHQRDNTRGMLDGVSDIQPTLAPVCTPHPPPWDQLDQEFLASTPKPKLQVSCYLKKVGAAFSARGVGLAGLHDCCAGGERGWASRFKIDVSAGPHSVASRWSSNTILPTYRQRTMRWVSPTLANAPDRCKPSSGYPASVAMLTHDSGRLCWFAGDGTSFGHPQTPAALDEWRSAIRSA